MSEGRSAGAPGRPGGLRPVRSFVLREGRMTPAQRRALERLWPRYGLELPEEGELDLEAAFGRRAPRVLDIGFGDGTALAAQARGRPGWDFLGVEVHRPGVGRLLHTLEREGIGNVRVLGRDVLELLRRLPPGAFQRVQLYFPDPWPKKRHHKRRLVQGPFLEGARRVLAPGGLLHLATDWEGYAAWMEEQVAAAGGFLPAARERLDPGEALDEAARAARAARLGRPETKFERRARAEGRPIWDLLYRKA